MNVRQPENYVSLIQDGQVRVKGVTPDIAHELKALGGREKRLDRQTVWVLDAADNSRLGALLGTLRDLRVSFVGGPAGWPPAEVFDDLREKGFVKGEFQEIIWIGSDQWVIRTR